MAPLVLCMKAQVQIRQCPACVLQGPLVLTQPLRSGRGQPQRCGFGRPVSRQDWEGKSGDGLERDGAASVVTDGRQSLDGCGAAGGPEDNFCFQSSFYVTLEHREDVPIALRGGCVPGIPQALTNGGFSVPLAGSGSSLL